MGKDTDQASVSVIVCTYEQEWEKLKMTLDSIICQKGVNVEVVITDDGSVIDHHDKVLKYFEEVSFTSYTFVRSKINTLCHWAEFLKESGKRWSFADVVPYKKDQGEICKVDVEEHPRLKEDYKKGIDEISRWNYVVLNDIAVGAAIIAETELIREYLLKIDGRVVYAEDNIYRLMMYDGVVGAYYPRDMILYEVGCGISTNGDAEWDRLISKDWDETNRIMRETYNPDDPLHRKIMKV